MDGVLESLKDKAIGKYEILKTQMEGMITQINDNVQTVKTHSLNMDKELQENKQNYADLYQKTKATFENLSAERQREQADAGRGNRSRGSGGQTVRDDQGEADTKAGYSTGKKGNYLPMKSLVPKRLGD